MRTTNTILALAVRQALTGGLLLCGMSSVAFADAFNAGDLIVSSTTYAGTSATVTVGQSLSVGTAVADGSFPNVFKNEVPDASFGVTSPISLLDMTTSGTVVNTLPIDTSKMTTSFASKSELSLNITQDGKGVTFMGYTAPVNTLDVSNSNTSQVVDATNPVTSTYAREIANVDLSSGTAQLTSVNAYSGNNGRAAIEVNGQYYMVGNAGNGSATGTGLSQLSDNTGVQTIAVGSSGNTTAVGVVKGVFGSSTGYQHGYTAMDFGATSAQDKTGKDANFRGETVFDNTLYVTKGSGSNGIDTVFQVGPAHALANGGKIDPTTATITPLPGFNTTPEKVLEANTNTPSGVMHPFGIWFANATTLFVADEGDGIRIGQAHKSEQNGGLQEWNLVGGSWTLSQIFQQGLVGHDIANTLGWTVQEDGLRNITGKVNSDGSFTIYGTSSTISNETTHDLGADPNEVVAITISGTSTAANTSFFDLQTAGYAQRFGGVALAPSAAVPLPSSLLMMLTGLGVTGIFGRRRARA